MDVYGENWDFDNMGVVVIDCIHDYEHVKADIQNSINTFNKPYIVFDDYGLFPDVKKGIDEFIESGVLRVEKKIGMSPGFEFSKTLNKVLKDFVVRSQNIFGKKCEFIPGWDCHGLPIEHKVMTEIFAKDKERLTGLSRDDAHLKIR